MCHLVVNTVAEKVPRESDLLLQPSSCESDRYTFSSVRCIIYNSYDAQCQNKAHLDSTA